MRFGLGFARHHGCAHGVLKAGVLCAVVAGGFAVSDANAQAVMVDGPAGGETVVRKSIAVGAAVIVRPKYEGSQEH